MSGGMFDGKNFPPPWALNPSTYQNMNSDEVDWAALAQQWIKFKGTAVPMTAPPPPILGNLSSTLNDGGAVPMDMDTKDDDIPPAPPAPTISGTESWNQWNQWGNQQWNQPSATANSGNWNWSHAPDEERKSLRVSNIPNNMTIPPPPNISQCPPYPIQQIPLSHSYPYNVMPPSQTPFNNQASSSNFWPNETLPHSEPKQFRKDTNRIPFGSMSNHPLIEPDSSRIREVREKTPEEDLAITLDNAKRRQLPAWIREGLEKMEREKQKAVEREQLEILRKKELEARKISEEEALAVLNPAKSKFDSDSDNESASHESNGGDPVIKTQKSNMPTTEIDNSDQDSIHLRKTRFQDVSSPDAKIITEEPLKNTNNKKSENLSSIVSGQNKEQILESIMLKVRRSLTEILLEVTNDEISSVCKEMWKRFHGKGSTGKIAQNAPIASASLSQLSRKLGLGIYSDSNSESDEDNPLPVETAQQLHQHDDESDEDLMEIVRQRQKAFEATEAEIEARLAEEEKDVESELDNRNRENSDSDSRDNDQRTKTDRHQLAFNPEGESKGKGRFLKKDDANHSSSAISGNKNFDSQTKKDYSAHDQDVLSSKATKSTGADSDEDLAEGEKFKSKDDSSDSESKGRYESKRKIVNRVEKDRKSLSTDAKMSQYSESKKRRSSSSSSSRSKSKYSSRENSCEPKSSSNADTHASSKSSNDYKVRKHRYRTKSRSTSRSTRRNRSESRSRSKSRSTSRSKSKYKRSRSRSKSRSKRSHRRRDSRRRKSRSRRKNSSHSRSSDSKSRSRSTSRRKSPSSSSYSRKSSFDSRRRDTRSRSSDRSKRSKSKSRTYNNNHRSKTRHHRDKSNKKSTSRH